MRVPLRTVRALSIAAVALFVVSLGTHTPWITGLVPALTVAAAFQLFNPPPRMRWEWHIALFLAVAASTTLALLADSGWVAVMREADGGSPASALDRAALPLYAAALICASAIISILTAQRVPRRMRISLGLALPAVVLLFALLPMTRDGVEGVGFFAGSLGSVAYLLAPIAAVPIFIATLHWPTIGRLEARWADQLRATAEAAEKATHTTE